MPPARRFKRSAGAGEESEGQVRSRQCSAVQERRVQMPRGGLLPLLRRRGGFLHQIARQQVILSPPLERRAQRQREPAARECATQARCRLRAAVVAARRFSASAMPSPLAAGFSGAAVKASVVEFSADNARRAAGRGVFRCHVFARRRHAKRATAQAQQRGNNPEMNVFAGRREACVAVSRICAHTTSPAVAR